jgi:hypothetical protein
MLAIWSALEPGMGIMAACLATLRPLLRKMKNQVQSRHSIYLFGSKLGRSPGVSSARNVSRHSKSYQVRSVETNQSESAIRPIRLNSLSDHYPTAGTDDESGESIETLSNHYVRYNTTPQLKPGNEKDEWIDMREDIKVATPVNDPERALAAFDFGLQK